MALDDRRLTLAEPCLETKGCRCMPHLAPLAESGIHFIRIHRPPPQLCRCTWLHAIEVVPSKVISSEV